MELGNQFKNLLANYTADSKLIKNLWSEISHCYSHPSRQYHNLNHLDSLIKTLSPLKHQMLNWDTVLFSVFYHDIVYDVLRNDNEEQSALLAENRLHQLCLKKEEIQFCCQMILATKSHGDTKEKDINLFTDADLSILGTDFEQYHQYTKDIRKEYAIYSESIYTAGRIKVLNHFLQMPRIFKTSHFNGLLETSARKNLNRELSILTQV